MLASFLITLREGLEAALIVGIVLSLLKKLEKSDSNKPVWLGVGAAIVVSIIIGLLLNTLGVSFEGRGEAIFEGIATLLAAGVLTWMIFWMHKQSRNIQTELEADVQQAVTQNNGWALFSLAFVAVVREGIETVLFLSAAAFSSTPSQTLLGGVLGLAVAVGLGWALFAAGKQLNLRAFFRITGGLLLFFAAGLLAYGVHELQEAALLPIFIEHVWDINPILNENVGIGAFLKALLGYNGNPSLLEVILYISYLVGIGLISWRKNQTIQASPIRKTQSSVRGGRDQ